MHGGSYTYSRSSPDCLPGSRAWPHDGASLAFRLISATRLSRCLVVSLCHPIPSSIRGDLAGFHPSSASTNNRCFGRADESCLSSNCFSTRYRIHHLRVELDGEVHYIKTRCSRSRMVLFWGIYFPPDRSALATDHGVRRRRYESPGDRRG